MATRKVSVGVKIDGTAKGYKKAAGDAEKATTKLRRKAKKESSGMMASFNKLAGVLAGMFVVRQVFAWAKAVKNAYAEQQSAEVKLLTIMRQRMSANQAAVDHLKELTAEYQKQGVIGDEIQLAGLQQLATFLKQKESLTVLLPAMNNLVAQQKGYNAKAIDAVNIANMMGRALTGQLGALSRIGITFTEAQGNALRFGDEVERAAAMAQILNDNVGNVNIELGKTKMAETVQLTNAVGDLKEAFGELLVLMGLGQKQIKTFIEKLTGGVKGIINILTPDVDVTGKSKTKLQSQIDAYTKLNEAQLKEELRKTIQNIDIIKTHKLAAQAEVDKGLSTRSSKARNESIKERKQAQKNLKEYSKSLEGLEKKFVALEEALGDIGYFGDENIEAIETLTTLNALIREQEKALSEINILDKASLKIQLELIKVSKDRRTAILDLIKVEKDRAGITEKIKPLKRESPESSLKGGLRDTPLEGIEGSLNLITDLELAFAGFFQMTDAGFAAMAKSFGNALKQMVAQLAAKAAIFGILRLLSGGITGVIADTASKALGSFKWFADGGIVSGPTMGMVGEYPGARSNPEIVAPLSKLKGMLADGTGQVVRVEGIISGKDLKIVLRRN